MKYETIRKCGELGIEFGEIAGPGARITKNFLCGLLKRIVVRSTQYYLEINDVGEPEHVFTYKERQLHSVVCPSIADITRVFLIEQPLTRKPTGEPEYRGSVDYWIYFENYTFLMELKHSYFAYRNASRPRKNVGEKFSRALEQLSDVKKGERIGLTYGDGIRRIALETVVFYKGAKRERKLEADVRNCDFKMLFRKLVKNSKMQHRSNLRSLWVLNRRLVKPVPYSKRFVIYPAVAFLAKVSEVTQ